MRGREGRRGGREEREEKEVRSKLGTNLQSNKFLILVLRDYLTGNAHFQENIG